MTASLHAHRADISRAPGHEVVRLGVVHSPEGRRIFPRMTVDENLDLGAFTRSDKEGIAADRDRGLELFPSSGDCSVRGCGSRWSVRRSCSVGRRWVRGSERAR